jgi:hypothetical protein
MLLGDSGDEAGGIGLDGGKQGIARGGGNGES